MWAVNIVKDSLHPDTRCVGAEPIQDADANDSDDERLKQIWENAHTLATCFTS